MAKHDHDHKILRYRRNQRFVHALLASSFILLLLTGMVLLWGPLSFLAVGGNSRWLHRVGAIAFMLVPVAYLLADREGAKELLRETFRYDRDDISWFKHMYRYAMGHAAEMPPQGRLNAGQKLHHGAVIVISLSIVLSGLAMWFIKPTLGATGLAWTAVIHDLSMLALTLLLVGHLYFTYVYKAMSSMTTGYVDEDEARLEHSKWVEEIEHAEEEPQIEKEEQPAPQT